MSHTRLQSDIVQIDNTSQHIFNYLSDFRNFEKLMPPQVTNWQASADECSFTINGMATIGMKIIEKTPNSKIAISSSGKVPFEFSLLVLITETGANSCTGQLIFEAELNMMLKMMVEKPLGNFFNMLAQKMKEIK